MMIVVLLLTRFHSLANLTLSVKLTSSQPLRGRLPLIFKSINGLMTYIYVDFDVQVKTPSFDIVTNGLNNAQILRGAQKMFTLDLNNTGLITAL